MAALIAIVGRPNVGKSALFNRLAGRRIAIVHDQPGVTRDRLSAEIEWRGHPFTLVDTGGIGLLRGEKARDPITLAAMKQVELAIASAQVILFVVDVQEGLAPLDEEVAERLRRSGKPILVVVNKVDTPKAEGGVADFAALGFSSLHPVSAIHGRGIEDLMQAAVAALPKEVDEVNREAEAIALEAPSTPHPSPFPPHSPAPAAAPGPAPALKIAIVGRPNVGKSSLINALTQSERVVVTPVPGTTRDAVDVPFEVETDGVRQSYVLIDTAGVRKKRRVDDAIEFFSVKRTEDAIRRSDLTVLVLDAEAGITEQDKKIADLIVDARRACLLVVNKWDLMAEAVEQARQEEQRRCRRKLPPGPKRLTTLAEFGAWVQEKLFFLDYAPVIFTSALSGFHLDRLLEAIRYVGAQWQQKVPTALLNRALHQAVERRQPVSAGGHRLKFFYATQVAQAPPTFLLFVNRADLFSDHYAKYLARELRRAFGYEGCPLVLKARTRPGRK
jgi:GTP-binding protein